MTGWAWVFLGTTVFCLLLAAVALVAVHQLADEVNRQRRLFREQERVHIKEIQDLANQYPPPQMDLGPAQPGPGQMPGCALCNGLPGNFGCPTCHGTGRISEPR
jgi:hypothetical protein